MTGLARHAVEGTRAVYCSISLMNDKHQLVARGGFGAGQGTDGQTGADWVSLSGSGGPVVDELMAIMTGGSIVLDDAPGPPVVIPDARSSWEASPALRGLPRPPRNAEANRVIVRLDVQEGVLGLAVSDDGAGFDPETKHPGHLGLSTMTERAAVIGASLTIVSAPSAGTTVTVALPYGRDVAEAGVTGAR